MGKLLFTVLACSFLLLPFQSIEPQNQLPAYDDTVAYEVYDTALSLNHQWAVLPKGKAVAIQMETQPAEMCLEPAEDFQSLMGPAISDYLEKNKTVWSLQKKFHAVKNYALLSREQLQGGSKIDHPKQYVNSFGFMESTRFSAVGFNSDKTIAVLHEDYYCGGRCGHEEFVVLQKKEGKWQRLDWRGLACIVNY